MHFKEIESQLKKGFSHLAELECDTDSEQETENQATNKDNRTKFTDKGKDKEEPRDRNKDHVEVQNIQEDQEKDQIVNRVIATGKVKEVREKQNNSEKNGLGQRRGEYRKASGTNKAGQVARLSPRTKEESWKTRSSVREHGYAKRKQEETGGSEVQLKRSRTDKPLLWIVGDSMIRGVTLETGLVTTSFEEGWEVLIRRGGRIGDIVKMLEVNETK